MPGGLCPLPLSGVTCGQSQKHEEVWAKECLRARQPGTGAGGFLCIPISCLALERKIIIVLSAIPKEKSDSIGN